jgi:hypothetical protein
MSDAFQFLVDERVSVAEAPFLAQRLRERLREGGWIERDVTKECVLSGRGHRPGPLAGSSFVPKPGELPWHRLHTTGVAIEAMRFTSLTYPFEADLFVCPRCEARVDVDQQLAAAAKPAVEAEHHGRRERGRWQAAVAGLGTSVMCLTGDRARRRCTS